MLNDRKIETAISKQVAARIKELREARGLSVRELARRSGVRPESILRSERADTEITITSLSKICVALTVDLPGFFAFTVSEPATDTRAPELRRALDLLATLPTARRRQVVQGIELLLGTPQSPSRRTKK